VTGATDSAVGDGLSELLDTLTTRVNERLNPSPSSSSAGDGAGAAADGGATEVLITRERHRKHLQQCVHLLDSFLAKYEGGDMVGAAEELRAAARSVSAVLGRIDVDHLLDVIFADFCIGK
jgi:hypothetical protein